MNDFKSEQKKKERVKEQEKRRLQLNVAFFGVFACAMILFLLLAFDKIPSAGGNSSKKVSIVKETEAETESSTGIETESETEIANPLPANTSVTVSLTGDCTVGYSESQDASTRFDAYYSMHGSDYFLQNVKDTLSKDDLTIVDFTSTLTTSTTASGTGTYSYKADPAYSAILTGASIEAANLANDHTNDYGSQGYTDTQTNLQSAGLSTFGGDETALVTINEVNVGLIGIDVVDNAASAQTQLTSDIADLQSQKADIIIVSFHWGTSDSTAPDETQVALAHAAIDAGADLVVGHNPKNIQKMETYNGKTIAYSLGKFLYGDELYPSNYNNLILQVKFSLNTKRELTSADATVIPCSFSSASADGYNNFQPSVLSDTDAATVQSQLDTLSAETEAAASTDAGGSTTETTASSDGSTADTTASTDGSTTDTTASTDGSTTDTTASTDGSTTDTTASTDGSSGGNTLDNTTQLFLPE